MGVLLVVAKVFDVDEKVNRRGVIVLFLAGLNLLEDIIDDILGVLFNDDVLVENLIEPLLGALLIMSELDRTICPRWNDLGPIRDDALPAEFNS